MRPVRALLRRSVVAISLLALFACAIPEPTHPPAATQLPTPTQPSTPTRATTAPQPPPTATPRPVTTKPEQLVRSQAQFPLPGFGPPQDTVESDGTIRRRFSPTLADPPNHDRLLIDVFTIRGSVKSWVDGENCKWRGTTTPLSDLQVRPPTLAGEAATACIHRFDDGFRFISYSSGVRNIALILQAGATTSGPTDAAALELLAGLADLQITLINQLDAVYM